jgi:hypothetical protein
MKISDAVHRPPSVHGQNLGHGVPAPDSMHFNSSMPDFPLPRLIELSAVPGRGRRSLAASRRAIAVTRATSEALAALDFLHGEEEKVDM